MRSAEHIDERMHLRALLEPTLEEAYRTAWKDLAAPAERAYRRDARQGG